MSTHACPGLYRGFAGGPYTEIFRSVSPRFRLAARAGVEQTRYGFVHSGDGRIIAELFDKPVDIGLLKYCSFVVLSAALASALPRPGIEQ